MHTQSNLRFVLTAFLLLLAAVGAPAQTRPQPTVPHEGSWVIEWTPKSRSCVVRFYNDQRQLIYEETLNRRLNIARRQTKRNLNVALDQAMYVWNATHKVPSDRQWVAVQFDRK
jgi:hypothetical protein